MANETNPAAIEATAAPTARPGRGYPEPFATRVAGRVRRPLGDFFGLTNFGVNLTRLPPGCMSALRHTHAREDEFIYVLEGEPVLGKILTGDFRFDYFGLTEWGFNDAHGYP